MSAGIPPAFTAEYSDGVTHAATQRTTKLEQHVRTALNVVGKTYDFHKMGTIVAGTRADGNFDEVVLKDPVSSTARATLTNIEAAVPAGRFDEWKTNINQIKEYQIETVTSIKKQVDQLIINALVAGTTTTLPTATGGLTYAKLLEAVKFFADRDVEAEDRVFVMSPKALTDALSLTQLTSADYMQVQAVMRGEIGTVLGMKTIVSSMLPIASTNRSCFAFQKQAVGLAIGSGVKTTIDPVPMRSMTLINSYASVGAVVVDPDRICKMTIVE